MKYLINLYINISACSSFLRCEWPRVSVLLSLPGTHGPKTFFSSSVSLTGLLIYVKVVKQDLYFLDQLFSFQKIRGLEMRVYILSYTVT